MSSDACLESCRACLTCAGPVLAARHGSIRSAMMQVRQSENIVAELRGAAMALQPEAAIESQHMLTPADRSLAFTTPLPAMGLVPEVEVLPVPESCKNNTQNPAAVCQPTGGACQCCACRCRGSEPHGRAANSTADAGGWTARQASRPPLAASEGAGASRGAENADAVREAVSAADSPSSDGSKQCLSPASPGGTVTGVEGRLRNTTGTAPDTLSEACETSRHEVAPRDCKARRRSALGPETLARDKAGPNESALERANSGRCKRLNPDRLAGRYAAPAQTACRGQRSAEERRQSTGTQRRHTSPAALLQPDTWKATGLSMPTSDAGIPPRLRRGRHGGAARVQPRQLSTRRSGHVRATDRGRQTTGAVSSAQLLTARRSTVHRQFDVRRSNGASCMHGLKRQIIERDVAVSLNGRCVSVRPDGRVAAASTEPAAVQRHFAQVARGHDT